MLDKIIKSQLGFEVVKELKFHEHRRWRFDYAIIELKIAIEVEGGVWMKKARHTSPKGFIADMQKYNNATALGWRLIRILPNDYESALKFIKLIIEDDKQKSLKNT